MITYVTGDATTPTGTGNKVIPHLCNDLGRWGAGFVLAVTAKWPQAEAEYLRAASGAPSSSKNKLALGTVQFVLVDATPGSQIWVANMVAQRAVWTVKEGTVDEVPPIRYPALMKCLKEVGKHAAANSASIHAPKFGAGLAGGDWDVIESLIESSLVRQHGRDVTVYNFPVAAQAPVAIAAVAVASPNTDALD